MIDGTEPIYESLLKTRTEDDVWYPINNMSKPILEIWDGGPGPAPLTSIPFDRESRRHINIRIKNIIERRDSETGKLKEDIKIYGIHKCRKDFFNFEFEHTYLEHYEGLGRHKYCIDHPDIILHGDHESHVLGTENSHIEFDIERCNAKH
jgi:hypothetical protein